MFKLWDTNFDNLEDLIKYYYEKKGSEPSYDDMINIGWLEDTGELYISLSLIHEEHNLFRMYNVPIELVEKLIDIRPNGVVYERDDNDILLDFFLADSTKYSIRQFSKWVKLSINKIKLALKSDDLSSMGFFEHVRSFNQFNS